VQPEKVGQHAPYQVGLRLRTGGAWLGQRAVQLPEHLADPDMVSVDQFRYVCHRRPSFLM
jgi:hypothetical protein